MEWEAFYTIPHMVTDSLSILAHLLFSLTSPNFNLISMDPVIIIDFTPVRLHVHV